MIFEGSNRWEFRGQSWFESVVFKTEIDKSYSSSFDDASLRLDYLQRDSMFLFQNYRF